MSYLKHIGSILVAAFVACAPGSVGAQIIAGADHPDFIEARDQWLAGDDLAALQGLGRLARGGNVAAQLLLGRIAGDQVLFAHVTADLTRTQRRELLRAPSGGLSGKSWITVAAEAGNPLAQAIEQVEAPLKPGAKEPYLDALEFLLDAGEPVAMARYMGKLHFILIGADDRLVAMVSDNQDLLPKGAIALLMRMQWMHLTVPYELEAGQLIGARLPGAEGYSQDLLESLAPTIEAWQPLYAYCTRTCPDNPARCTVAGAYQVGGIMPFASPLESVISTETYWASERMDGDLIRRISPQANWLSPPGEGHYVERLDACLYGQIWDASQD